MDIDDEEDEMPSYQKRPAAETTQDGPPITFKVFCQNTYFVLKLFTGPGRETSNAAWHDFLAQGAANKWKGILLGVLTKKDKLNLGDLYYRKAEHVYRDGCVFCVRRGWRLGTYLFKQTVSNGVTQFTVIEKLNFYTAHNNG